MSVYGRLKMRTVQLLNTLCFLSLVRCVIAQPNQMLPEQIQPGQIKSVMTKVADWQLENPSKHHTTDWKHGALFAGMMVWAQMADTEKYYETLIGFGEKNQWQLGSRYIPYHADDHCVGQMYIEMYKQYRDPKMIVGTQERFDWILANQPDTPLTHDKGIHKRRWNWCDALFMTPPVWAKLARITGEQKYLDYMNKEWKATTSYLCDPVENLYYRDSNYFNKREANGKKIFWSRGNGWSYAGLVRVIEELPENHVDFHKYVEQYKKMSVKLKSTLPEDGLWRSSLLDPFTYQHVETSGSGFHCYGLAWGINHGYLEADEYLPTVIKAWKGLVSCVDPDGMLGYVQPIGLDPQHVKSDDTEIYAVGSFLLAGSEVFKIAVREGAQVVIVIAENPTLKFRDSETISLDFKEIQKSISAINKDSVAVYDFRSNRLLVTQIIQDQDKIDLLFQSDFAPGQKKYFWIMKQPSNLSRPKSKLTTYCRYISERQDDFAWENDCVAFRVYGPGMWKDAVNSGVDCCLKRVDYPIIDKWYGNMKEQSYHIDWGEGYDPYHVGKSPGCGGLAIGENGKYTHSNVYDSWKVIANGPIRSVFELTYDKSWKASDKQLVETKRISIDLGQQLCRFESIFTGPDAPEIKEFAIGITTHDQKAQSEANDYKGIVYCWETIDGEGLGTGAVAVMPPADPSWTRKSNEKDESSVNLIVNSRGNCSVIYYAGFGWSKAGKIETVDQWKSYLEDFKERIDHPIRINYKN